MKRVYVIDLDGQRKTFKTGAGTDDAKEVLLDFSDNGALDDHTYQITLADPTACFCK